MNLRVEFSGTGVKSDKEPNPNYPDGVPVLDLSEAGTWGKYCEIELTPVAEMGLFRVTCGKCKGSFIIPVCGLADDPRSVRVPCFYWTEVSNQQEWGHA